MPHYLLALNCGSSSLKSTLFSYPALEQLATLSASSIGSEKAALKVKVQTGDKNASKDASHSVSVKGESHSEIFSDILKELGSLKTLKLDSKDIKVVTHRIVHGGTFDAPVLVTKDHPEALGRMEEVCGCHCGWPSESRSSRSNAISVIVMAIQLLALGIRTAAQPPRCAHSQGRVGKASYRQERPLL